MKIPHLARDGKFRPQIRKGIGELAQKSSLQIALSPDGGYSGEVRIRIGSATERNFEAYIDLSDPTRFPARIRAAATELREQGFTGEFWIRHHNGALEIQRLKK